MRIVLGFRNQQSAIRNRETHPLPRGGTDDMARGFMIAVVGTHPIPTCGDTNLMPLRLSLTESGPGVCCLAPRSDSDLQLLLISILIVNAYLAANFAAWEKRRMDVCVTELRIQNPEEAGKISCGYVL